MINKNILLITFSIITLVQNTFLLNSMELTCPLGQGSVCSVNNTQLYQNQIITSDKNGCAESNFYLRVRGMDNCPELKGKEGVQFALCYFHEKAQELIFSQYIPDHSNTGELVNLINTVIFPSLTNCPQVNEAVLSFVGHYIRDLPSLKSTQQKNNLFNAIFDIYEAQDFFKLNGFDQRAISVIDSNIDDLMAILTYSGISQNRKIRNNLTPIMVYLLKAQRIKADTVRRFLAFKASPFVKDDQGRSVIDLVVSSMILGKITIDDAEIVIDEFIKRGVDLNKVDNQKTLLDRVIQKHGGEARETYENTITILQQKGARRAQELGYMEWAWGRVNNLFN